MVLMQAFQQGDAARSREVGGRPLDAQVAKRLHDSDDYPEALKQIVGFGGAVDKGWSAEWGWRSEFDCRVRIAARKV